MASATLPPPPHGFAAGRVMMSDNAALAKLRPGLPVTAKVRLRD